jgi:hypothetical protein
MDLSPEEQSFFDAGEEMSGPQQPEDQGPRPHRSRRRSRRHSSHRHGIPRRRKWFGAPLSVILTIAAVGAGYWVSTYVIQRDLPDPADFGVEVRGR